jgi:hypothetical protein
MRPLLIYLSLQNLALCLFGQIDSSSKAFIYEILSREPGSDTLTYTDRIDTRHNQIFFKTLNNSKIFGYEIGTKKKVELTLSSTDRRKLANAVNSAARLKWDDSLFDNSRIISVDSLWQYISRRNREVSELIRTDLATGDNMRHANAKRVSYCSVFQFSKPIFLKGQAIVIFYFRRLCGGECGIEDLSVYKLKEGVYRRWLLLGGGAF